MSRKHTTQILPVHSAGAQRAGCSGLWRDQGHKEKCRSALSLASYQIFIVFPSVSVRTLPKIFPSACLCSSLPASGELLCIRDGFSCRLSGLKEERRSEGAGSGAASCEASPMFGLLSGVMWYRVMSSQKSGYASKSTVPLSPNQTAF